jgi:hypothetical protein
VDGAVASVAPHAVWRVSALATPTSFLNADTPRCEKNSHDCDMYSAVVTNVGNGSSNGTIEIKLSTTPIGPAGVIIKEAELLTEDGKTNCTPSSESEVTCESSGSVRPGGIMGMRVSLTLGSGLSGVATGDFKVEGGGAEAAEAGASVPIDADVPGGIDRFRFEALDREGQEDVRAGDHPARLLNEVGLVSTLEKDPLDEQVQPLVPVEEPKSVAVEVPVGFLGDPEVAPKCSPSALVEGPSGSRCPADTQIGGFAFVAFGHLEINTTGDGGLFPIYNLSPENGYPAEFGINYNNHPVILYASVVWRNGTYKLRVTAPSVPRLSRSVWLMTEFFGEPAVWDHGPPTSQEIVEEEEEIENGEPVKVRRSEAFLTNPMDCAQASTGAAVEVTSWTDPEHPSKLGAGVGDKVGECNLLQFAPSLEVGAESSRSEEPTGYAVRLRVPEPFDQAPELATPELQRATVQMPLGTTLSPSAAYGLAGCQREGPEGIDIGREYETENGVSHLEAGHCPNSSKIGTAEIKSPLLPLPLRGSVYLREPECGVGGAPACTNADAEDGKLLGLYVEVEEEAPGTNSTLLEGNPILKLEGTASVNTQTGQVTTTFANNPQFPASEIKIQLNGGPDASLTNPQSCGAATATSEIEPWSAPFTPTVTPMSSFDVDWDGAGGACPATLPFNPVLTAAGTTSSTGSGYSPFTLTVNREDREQNIKALSVQLPPGMLAAISKVALCPEPQASTGQCGAESEIGSTTVAVGAGSHPYSVKGRVFLTGPYGGGPFGLSVVVPAVAGPFNLGLVVVRAAIEINSRTAQVTTVTSELPQMIDGVPLRMRVLSVTLNREQFVFNPTNCSPMSVNATVYSAQGAAASLSKAFTATGCKNLPFKPSLSMSTNAISTKANGSPVSIKISYPSTGEANLAKTILDFPKQLPARLETLQKACTDAVFEANPAGCPPASVIGTALVHTPILSVPLTGPIYLVSHGGAKFPDSVLLLQGEGVKLVVDGESFISSNGVLKAIFSSLPDAPFSSFEATLPEGAHSLFIATAAGTHPKVSLCGQSLATSVMFVGQNGTELKQNANVGIGGCGPTVSIVKTKLKGNALQVTLKTSTKGNVTITGADLKTTTKKNLAKGSHTITIALTKTGRTAKKHKRKVTIKATLRVGKTVAQTKKAIKL